MNRFWKAIEWDFQGKDINALDFFRQRCRCGCEVDPSVTVVGRDWSQFIRFYETFTRVRGSYLWAEQLTDPEIVQQMVDMPESEWSKGGPPPLFGWSDLMERLTDLGDQLIAARPHEGKIVFYPRPEVPAVKLRKLKKRDLQDDRVEQARQRNRERREAADKT